MASLIIPAELIRPIIENITSTSTLHSLCLSSKLLRSETEPILYRSFTGTSNEAHTLFLTTIVNNQRLADFVRVFYSKGVIGNGTLGALTRLGLERMHGLKELVLSLHQDSSLIAASLLEHCAFSLEILVCHDHTKESGFIKFLEHQVSLKYFEWWDNSWWDNSRDVPPGLSSTALPNLCTLSSFGTIPIRLLPGRRIRHLQWMSPKAKDIQSHLSNISEELSRLLSMSLALRSDSEDKTFMLLSKSLRSLEFLELLDGDTDDFNLISTLPCLRVLVLSSRNYVRIPVDERQGWMQTFFAGCPHLTRVDIYHGFDRSRRMYERWEVGDAPNERLLTYEEVSWTSAFSQRL
ncbi:hypothetical protein BDZ97DRAFT_1797270 [Flammula alnicola]|nr:hypothetical protein BDZ97DRAFT_1797270 [Flammula alnicola]